MGQDRQVRSRREVLGWAGNVCIVWAYIKESPFSFIVLFTTNILFDYLSVTKSRFLIDKLVQFHKKYSVVILIFSDLILTAIIILAWAAVDDGLTVGLLGMPVFFVHDFRITLMKAFYLTTYLTLLITLVYSINANAACVFQFSGKDNLYALYALACS